MEIREIEIGKIKTNSKWLRNDVGYEGLKESIELVGLINPLIVSKDLELLAGSRRFQAIKSLGWGKVPCVVMTLGEAHSELISIDENLERENLTGVELDDAMARRKELYEILHPETRHGYQKNRGNQHKSGELHTLQISNFVDDTSDKTGKSKRSIYQSIKRANESSEKVKQARIDCKIGSAHVDALIKLPKKDQDVLLPYIEKVPWTVANEMVERAKETSIEQVINEQEQISDAIRILNSIKANGRSLSKSLQLAISSKLVFHGRDLLDLNMVMAGVLDYGNQFMQIQKRRK